MYSRIYSEEDGGRVKIPEKYDGTSMLSVSKAPSLSFDDIPPCHPTKIPKDEPTFIPVPEEEECSAEAEEVSVGNPLLSFLGLGSGGLFGNLPFTKYIGNIGREEIIILAIALLLLFSKGGDKWCALLIGALIFIK